jgi:hypothetical protein
MPAANVASRDRVAETPGVVAGNDESATASAFMSSTTW